MFYAIGDVNFLDFTVHTPDVRRTARCDLVTSSTSGGGGVVESTVGEQEELLDAFLIFVSTKLCLLTSGWSSV